MNWSIDHIKEPFLEFGHGQRLKDPKDGLFLFGPLEDRRPGQLRAGLVGTPKGISIFRRWLNGAKRFIPTPQPESPHHLAYPGFEEVFQSKWPDPRLEIAISATERTLNEDDTQVDVWFVIIPDLVWRLGRPLSRPTKVEALHDPKALGRKLGRRFLKEPSLFAEDMTATEPYRYDVNFHHQLKARLLPSKAVVQVVRESSLQGGSDDLEAEEGVRRRLQDPASVAWNLTTTAFFKAGGRPWKLADIRPGVCYVGLVFKINTVDEGSGNACCGAQMFLDSGDGLVFKGAMGPWYSNDRKEFFLSKQAAHNLIDRVVTAYTDLHGKPPDEMFIHGRKRFSHEEWEGFSSAVSSSTSLVCVRISRSQEMKLYRPGRTPVLRGSTFPLTKRSSLLWTTGYVAELVTYPGRDVPNPLLVEISRGEAAISTVLADVMSLTKVNFNACIFADGLPVTLRFAEAVGEILTAAPHVEGPPLPFRHYI